jgi:hypothetical protein
MGYSIQSIGHVKQSFNDLDLVALVGLMSEIVQLSPEDFCFVSPLVAEWERALIGYGPGVIDMNLDEVVSSESVSREFGALLSRTANRIRDLGPSVPATLLNARCQAPGVKFAEFPSSLLLEALEQLRSCVFSG